MISRHEIAIIVKAFTGQAKAELKEFGGSLKTLETVGKLALTALGSYVGMQTVRAVTDLTRWAASNMEVAHSFEMLSERYNLASDKIVDALKRASKGTVSEIDLMKQANKALRLGVATTVEEFEQLMKVAYIRAKEFGISVADAWEYMVVGIGRASPMILDNIGILMDANITYKEYAASIGKAAEELTVFEKKAAIRNRILREGAPDMERWNEMGETAADVFAEYDAVMADLRQELGEALLPAVVTVTGALKDMITTLGTDPAELVAGFTEAQIKRAEKLTEEVIAQNRARYRGRAALVSWQEALKGVSWQEKVAEEVTTKLAQSYGDIDIKMHDVAAASRDVADAQEELAEDTEDAAKAAERAAEIWYDYTQSVADANWRFARRVEDAQFRASQAAEDAAFRLYEIERNANQRREDAIRSFESWQIGQLEDMQADIQRMWRDHYDQLRDMEWDYQWERRDLLKKAPWWIRNALQREFRQRERIAATGDKEALARYDKALKERIRAIDPVYAEELDLLEERYEHERNIERREARQSERDERDDYRRAERQQRRQLEDRLRQVERGLQNEREAWSFHSQQRLENERHAMDTMIREHDHSLARMLDDARHRLSQLPPLYEQAGLASGEAFVRGLTQARNFTPLPPGTNPSAWTNPFAPGGDWNPLQAGMAYVPRTMGAIIHKGEAVLPAPAAERWRQGGVTINIDINLQAGTGFGVGQSRQFARELSEIIGENITKKQR